jgi:glycosyltransferase involved in cell wall biosynthesis
VRLALLGPASSIHLVRWANALTERGHEIHLLSAHAPASGLDSRVRFHRLPAPPPLGYFLNALRVRRTLRQICPDLLHTHYASGYGTLGRLSRFHPYVLSVWGSDVYEFPGQSFLKRRLLIANLAAADQLCATSGAMAGEVTRLDDGLSRPTIVGFGVDTSLFAPSHDRRDEEGLTVGTVKSLSGKYGVDLLLRAFARARAVVQAADPATAARLRLRIVGEGPDRSMLEALSAELGLSDLVDFPGPVHHGAVPAQLGRLDVYVALSRQESYGVAVLEASACAVPVVVSDVGGLPEVVVDGETGIVVESGAVEAAAAAIARLVLEPDLRRRMGTAGRENVLAHHAWSGCVRQMEDIYERVLDARAGRAALPSQNRFGVAL